MGKLQAMAADWGFSQKKGEKGSRIIFYKTLIKDQENEQDGEDVRIPMLRQYTVFNAAQVEGFEDQEQNHQPEKDNVDRNTLMDEFCKSTGADIRSEESEAYYSPLGDYINMPDTALFYDTKHASATENYYSTLLHELTHWTGGKKRLDRKNDPNKKHIENYAFEELIAELGAAFLCAQHHINQTPAQRPCALYQKLAFCFK